jgi:predicted metal-dependent hydrolase
MTSITTHIPRIDWNEEFTRHWNAGSPATTHVFNALSFTFPQGERFFMRVAKEVYDQNDTHLSDELDQSVRAFFIQEAAHTKQHQMYNNVLEKQGYENVTYTYIERSEAIAHRFLSARFKLAIVCAYEHYTALLGNFILKNPQVLAQAEKKMALMWGWHAAEETEHKAVCFDLYKTVGGTWWARIVAFALVSVEFLVLFLWLYFSLLRKDGCLKRANLMKTIVDAGRFFWGKSGVAWHLIWHGTRYLSPFFHPWNQNNRSALKNWITRHKKDLKEILIKSNKAS